MDNRARPVSYFGHLGQHSYRHQHQGHECLHGIDHYDNHDVCPSDLLPGERDRVRSSIQRCARNTLKQVAIPHNTDRCVPEHAAFHALPSVHKAYLQRKSVLN